MKRKGEVMKKEHFGIIIKNLREERGMTLQELSIKSGIHQSTISRLENEPRRRPHVETFIQLAKGFGLSIQELAIQTKMIEPSEEEEIVIYDEILRNNFHLLNKQNLELLLELEDVSPEIKSHLINFITGLKMLN